MCCIAVSAVTVTPVTKTMKPRTKVFDHFTSKTVNDKITYCCNYCNFVYAFKNVTKFACHLSKCPKTPSDVHDVFKEYNKKKSSAAKDGFGHGELCLPSSSGVQPVQPSPRAPIREPSQDSGQAETSFASLSPMTSMSNEEKVSIHQAIARAIYVTGAPLSLFEHQLWKEAFYKLNPLYKLPSRKQLGTSLLDREYEEVNHDIKEKIRQANVLHLAIDGWSNLRKEPIINVIVYMPKPIFYKFIETTENRHTAEYLCDQVLKVIEEFDTSKFFGIVTDNAANMVRFGKLLHEKHIQTNWTGCLAHTLHLFVGDVLKMLKVRQLFASTVNVIKIISRSHLLGAEYRRIAEEKSINMTLHLPVKTRWGSYLFCLQSYIKSKLVLQNMAINNARGPLSSYKSNLLNEVMWTELNDLEQILRPIVQWILLLEGDYYAVHLVHKALTELSTLLHIPISAGLLQDSLPDLRQKFEERKNNALKPIHLAAAILDPKNQGAFMTNEEYLDGCEVIINMTGENAHDILVDVANYKSRRSHFEKAFIWKMAETVEPVIWWETLFSKTTLGQIAIKLLTVPATSAAVERSFSTFSHVHSKKRNRLKTNRAGKITFISHNWKLVNKPTPKKPVMPSILDCIWEPGSLSSDSEDEFSDVDLETDLTPGSATPDFVYSDSDTEIENVEINNPVSSAEESN